MEIKQQIPVVEGHFLLGSLKEVKKDFLAFMARKFVEHGSVLKFYLGRKPVYMISDPELIEQLMVKHKDVFIKAYLPDKPRGLALVLGQGLVTSLGALWKSQRRMIQPIFHRSNIATMSDKISELSSDYVSELKQKDGAVVDMATQLSALTLEIISQTMFGHTAEKLSTRLSSDLETLLDYAQTNLFHPFPLPRFIPTRKNRQFNKARAFLTDSIIEIIEQRKTSGEKHDDLLDVLLQARDEETGVGMSSQQIVDEALTIYSAGHETTATALTWALYMIATHVEVRDKLEAELDSVLQGRSAAVDELQNLPYMRAVLEETMRLYPSIVLLLRRVASNQIVTDHLFQKNSYTLINLYNLHRAPAYWEQPETFRPERFMAENREKIKKYTYLPFGVGQRVCIGNHFAMMEAMLILATLMQAFRFDYASPMAPVPKLAVSLRPAAGMPMRITRRESTNTANYAA